ncbi:MAG: GIY-YIG nuclease family protein, partial [bacterium]|nr:GIY-YIG nuclease family protein [bacterium]
MIYSQVLRKKLPDASGVYFFLGRNKKILYIGKATSLRSRVRSYFVRDIVEVRSTLIKQMVDEAISLDFRVTDSVLEALILEADLIKKFQPKYNTDEKDDKSFN